MKRSTWTHRVGGLAAAVLGVCLLAPATARAAVEGSLHDFSATGPNGQRSIDKGGVCTPCHSPHYSPYLTGGWPRDMANETIFYEQDGGIGANYLPGAALLCYDCHDDNASADADPANAVFADPPQDIALNGAANGYYENACGDLPVGANPAPTDGSPTGGHYWKSVPSGSPVYDRGDKIPCSLCHDPHQVATGTNEAFFRTTTWDGSAMKALNDFNSYGTDLNASTYNATTLPNGSRNGTGTGRQMCGICHGYSDQGTQATLYGVTVPQPPAGVPEHVRDDTVGATACVACHGHNQIAGCNECHGYPPLVATPFDRITNPDGESYGGGAGAHQRHRNALAAVGSTIFDCALCHGPNPGRPGTAWHNEGSGATCGQVLQANVDIRGLTSYWGAGSSYNGTTTGGDATYAFAAKGGPDGASPTGRCADLTCHGMPPASAGTVFLNWSDKMVDDTAGAFPAGDFTGADGVQICKWCHDATPARIGTGPWAPNVLGDGTNWGADVNGHGKAAGNYDADSVGEGTPAGAPAASKQCTVCHDARYTTLALPAANTPARTHFDNAYETSASEKRLRDTINGLPAADSDAACTNCHQNAAGADSATATSQVSTHGNSFTGAAEALFSRPCRQCHEVHGSNWNGAGRNLHMVGKWLDSPTVGTRGVAEAGEQARVDSSAAATGTPVTDITTGDLPVVFTTNSGENSYDDGFDDGQHESVCVVCHRAADMNSPIHADQNTVESTTLRGAGHSPVGTDCTQCHKHEKDTLVPPIAFKPSGCNGCHGTALVGEPLQPGAIAGQYWPDGLAVIGTYAYADNNPGSHLNHVEAISLQIFNEDAATLVTDTFDVSFNKQREVCAFCHPDPGGAGHFLDEAVAPSPALRVDVLRGGSAGNYFRKYTTGAHVTWGNTNFTDDVTALDSTYSFATFSCSNLVCHNVAATPTGASNWNVPPNWAPGANADCSNTTCHATGTYTNAHAVHVGNAQKNYACTECHANNYAPVNLGHGNGGVDMVWNSATSIEGSAGAGDGFYDKEAGGAASPGDTAFAYKTPPYNVACNLVYCHGGDNAAWGGGDITPVWDNSVPDSVYCGSCHDGNGTVAPNGDTSVIATGNHADHLSALYGPNWGNTGCVGTLTTGCHTAFDTSWVPSFTATHVDGTIQFADIALTAAPLATTDRCSNCHSTAAVTVYDALGVEVGPTSGTALVKTQANWANTAYELPCLTCHNGADAATNFADGTGRTAPNMLGTDSANESGAEIRGHGLTTGNYPISNNPAANKYCTVCHDRAVAHLNDSNDTTFAGNRMLGVIEGYTLPAQTAAAVCESCHARVASAATRKNVNQHSNNGYPAPTATTQGRLEAVFTLPECLQCHDPHGMTGNGTSYNIYMVPSTITVVPGAAPVTVPNVRFENLTGDYSFNDTLGAGDDDLCVVCHVNAGNPGFPMTNVTGDGRHYINNDPSNPLAFYDADERRRNCTGCHTHNRDNLTGNLPANMDGFMPVACNSCHTYPGLANLGGATHPNSATHNIHAGDPVAGPLNNYAFRCRTCHYQNDHNQASMNVGDGWVSVPANVNIRFDPARNGGSPTYDGANASSASAPGVGGTGACVLLYCHGNGTNGTNGGNLAFPAGFQGTQVAPQWSVTADGDCGTCHQIASSTAPIGTLAHDNHVDSFVDGGYAIGCQVCHYGTTTSGATVPAASMPIHVNGSVEVSFNAAADLRVDGASVYNNAGDNALGAPYYDCSATYCHSTGTVTAAPYIEPPAWTIDWDQPSDCGSCHGDGASAPMPEYPDGTPKANKHDKHVTENGYGCQACHYPTTTTGNTVTTLANHVNRVYNVNDNPADDPTLGDFTYNAGGATCTAAACHGGHTAGGLVPAWATVPPIDCNDCHGYTGGVATAADTNNFAWNGPTAATTTQSKIAAAEFTGFGHGAQGQACSNCHESTEPHDLNMNGANPYRLAPGFTCTDTGACHTGATSSTVRTHSNTEMIAAGFATSIQRTWPWVTMCVNCHDPHGDGANLTMIQRELYDKAPFPLTGAAPAAPTEQVNLDFTDRTTGIGAGSFAWSTEASPNYSAVCQECHELAPGSGGLVSFHDGPAGGTTVDTNHPANPGKCTDCHRHSAAFAPSGCEGCHNLNAYDPGGGDAVAPNVMGDGTEIAGASGHTTPKPFDDGTYGYNVNGHGRDADTNAESRGNVIDEDCSACHDISLPAGKHLDGVLDGHSPASGNNNPFHLVSGFLAASPTAEWSAQVTFDNYCWTACHQGRTTDMRHAKDNVPAANAAELGTHNSYTTPMNTPPPDMFYDANIAWLGVYNGVPNFGLCVSCHNPHGTDVVSPRGDGNNKMAIFRWARPAELCNKCHP